MTPDQARLQGLLFAAWHLMEARRAPWEPFHRAVAVRACAWAWWGRCLEDCGL